MPERNGEPRTSGSRSPSSCTTAFSTRSVTGACQSQCTTNTRRLRTGKLETLRHEDRLAAQLHGVLRSADDGGADAFAGFENREPARFRLAANCAPEKRPEIAEGGALARIDIFGHTAGEENAVDLRQRAQTRASHKNHPTVARRWPTHRTALAPCASPGARAVRPALWRRSREFFHRDRQETAVRLFLSGRFPRRRLCATKRAPILTAVVPRIRPASMTLILVVPPPTSILSSVSPCSRLCCTAPEPWAAMIVSKRRSGGGANEFAAFVGEQLGDLRRIVAPRRLAGNNHRAGVDGVAAQSGFGKCRLDQFSKRSRLDIPIAGKRREQDRRAGDHMALQHQRFALQDRRIADQQPGKHQMRGRRTDIDTDAGQMGMRPHRALMIVPMIAVTAMLMCGDCHACFVTLESKLPAAPIQVLSLLPLREKARMRGESTQSFSSIRINNSSIVTGFANNPCSSA